jgi:hypothetical protein
MRALAMLIAIGCIARSVVAARLLAAAQLPPAGYAAAVLGAASIGVLCPIMV